MDKEKEYCVYKHTAPNGKVYIGQTCQKPENRWKNGKGYSNNKYFSRAIRKYSWDNFKHEILFENLTKEEADALEIELIKKYNSTNKDFGFNMENGGYGKGKHSIETLKKMSEGRKGIPAWNKGIPLTEKQRALLSEINKGKPSTFKGKHHTEESKKKLSESHSKDKKPVVCIETNVIYESIRDAERQTGVNHKYISLVCNGIIRDGKRYLTAGGYHWCFLNEYDKNTYIIKKPKPLGKQQEIICIETGIVYETLKEASEKTGIYIDTIRKVCNKTKHYKTAGGYHWMFYDDYLKAN